MLTDRFSLPFALVLALSACAADTDPTPAPCDTGDDCANSARCVHLHDRDTGAEGPGYCHATGSGTSITTPAQCTTNDDCGSDGLCLFWSDGDDDEQGFCELQQCPRFCETESEEDATVCDTDADCGEGIPCGAPTICI